MLLFGVIARMPDFYFCGMPVVLQEIITEAFCVEHSLNQRKAAMKKITLNFYGFCSIGNADFSEIALRGYARECNLCSLSSWKICAVTNWVCPCIGTISGLPAVKTVRFPRVLFSIPAR